MWEGVRVILSQLMKTSHRNMAQIQGTLWLPVRGALHCIQYFSFVVQVRQVEKLGREEVILIACIRKVS